MKTGITHPPPEGACWACVSRLIPIWLKLGQNATSRRGGRSMSDSTTKQTPSQIYMDVGTRFDLGGGRTGPGPGCQGRMGTTATDGEPRSCGREPRREGVGAEVPGEAWSAEFAFVAARPAGRGNVQHLEAVEEEVAGRGAGRSGQFRGACGITSVTLGGRWEPHIRSALGAASRIPLRIAVTSSSTCSDAGRYDFRLFGPDGSSRMAAIAAQIGRSRCSQSSVYPVS